MSLKEREGILEITLSTLISLAALVISFTSFLYMQFKTLSEIREKLTAVETANETRWKIYEPCLVSLLRQELNIRKDMLLDRFVKNQLDECELQELATHLRNDIEEKALPDGKKLAAVLLLGRIEDKMEKIRKEKKKDKKR